MEESGVGLLLSNGRPQRDEGMSPSVSSGMPMTEEKKQFELVKGGTPATRDAGVASSINTGIWRAEDRGAASSQKTTGSGCGMPELTGP